MAKLAGFNIPKQFIVGAVAGIFSSVLVWLISVIEPLAANIATQLQGRAGLLTSTVTGTNLGEKLVTTMTSKFALTLPDVLIAMLGGGVLVMIGKWLYDMDWSPDTIPGLKGTPTTKLILVLFYASGLATIALSFALPSLTTLAVLAVNSVVTAWFVVKVLNVSL